MDSSVALAATYLQLNGFFVLTELPVQVAEHQGYRTATDLDVLAIRLPHGAELIPSPRSHLRDLFLGQDPLLDTDAMRTEVLICEVKRGKAAVNDGYRDADVLRFALHRTGCCPPELIEQHAAALARAGTIETRAADGHPCRIRLACFSGQTGSVGGGVLCVDLAHCLAFIRGRLDRYETQLRGAYFRDPVLNLLGLIDALPERKKESVHAT